MKKNVIEIIACAVILTAVLVVVFVIIGKGNNDKKTTTHKTTHTQTTRTTTKKDTTKEDVTTYSITYELYGGTNSSDNPKTYDKNSNITLSNATKDGFEFKGWYLEPTFETKVTIIDSSFSKNLKLYAKFEEIIVIYDYTIEYYLDGGTNNPDNPTGFMDDETFTLLDPTKPGYDFKGWFTTEAYSNQVYGIEYNHNYILYAKFTIHEYSINYHNVNGVINPNKTTYTINDSNIDLINVEKDDFIFYGWYLTESFDEESKVEVIDTTLLKDYDVYAKFVEKEVPQLTISSNNSTYTGSSIDLVDATVTNGTLYYSLDSDDNFTTTIPSATNAGTYTIYYKVIGDEGYKNIDTTSIQTTISNATLEVNITPYVGVIDYEPHRIATFSATTVDESTATWLFSKNQKDWYKIDEILVSNVDDSGTYYYKVTAPNHNEVTDSFTVSISPKEETTLSIKNLSSLSKEYDGNKIITPEIDTNDLDGVITITYSADGINYTSNVPVNAGTYTIKVHKAESANYLEKTIIEEIEISKKALTVTVTINDKVYDGTNAAEITSITLNGVITGDDVNLAEDIVAAFSDVNAGNNISVNISGIELIGSNKDNYYISEEPTASANISKANPKLTNPTANDLTYTSNDQALIEAGSTNGGTLVYSLDGENYSTDVPIGKNALTYTVYYKVNGDSNYNDVEVKTIEVEIKKAEMTHVNVTGYNGHEVESIKAVATKTADTVGNATVTWLFKADNGEWMSEDELLVGSASDSGIYHFKAMADNHIDVYGDFEVIITKKTPTTIEEINLSKTYDKLAVSLTTDDVVTNSDGEKTISYYQGDTLLDYSPINVGIYRLVITISETEDFGPGNYSTTFEISKAELTVSITINDKVYDGTDAAEIANITLNGVFTGDDVALNEGITATFSDVNAGNNISVNISGIELIGSDKDNYYISEEITASANISKANPTLTNNPTANDLTYTGSVQALIEAGSTTGGTLVYSLDGENYSTDIPTGLNALTYTVYYKVNEDSNYNGIDANTIEVEIKKANSEITSAPTAIENLTYTGSNQDLINGGVATGGTLVYSLDGENYSADIPQGLNALTYTVYYKVLENENYNGIDSSSFNVEISKANPVLTSPEAISGLVYDTTPQELITIGSTTGGTLVYSLDGTNYSADIPTGLNALTYTVYYKVIGDSNYNGIDSASFEVVITKATPEYTVPTGLQASYSNTLEDITLPEGFYFQDSLDTPVGPAGFNTFLVTYTPNDTDNYNVVENIEVQIKVIGDTKLVIECSDNQEATYNKTAQGPSVVVKVSGSIVDSSTYTLTYQYKTASTSYANGLPTNAGVYTIKINCSGEGYTDANEKTVTYTINKKTLTVTNTTIEKNYGDISRTWNDMKGTLQSSITVSGIISGDTVNVVVSGMHDGKYKYGTVSGSYTNPTNDTIFGSSYGNVIGSTYLVLVSQDTETYNNNYEIDGNYQVLFKYKTAKIGSTYYTIEAALSTTGTITFAGDSTNAQSYVATTFSSLSTSITGYNTTYTLSGRQMTVPYNASSTSSISGSNLGPDNAGALESGKTQEFVFSALVIPSHITINFTNSSVLLVDANVLYYQSGSSTWSNFRGVIVNDGTINFDSSKLFAYGYVKGNGTINLRNSSSALDILDLYDFSGGTIAENIYSKCLPFTAWTMNNISCKAYYYSGSTLSGWSHAILSIVGEVQGQAMIIGTTNSSNCLFMPLAISNSNYVVKYATPSSTNRTSDTTVLRQIIGNNQKRGIKQVVELTGEYKDSTVSVSISVTITTSDTKSLPVPYMDIVLKENSSLSITKADYLFLPGSSFKVEENATLTIGSKIDVALLPWSYFRSGYNFYTNCVDKTDAILINNGTITFSGNIGGYVTSEVDTATLNINGGTTASYTMYYRTSGSPTYETKSSKTYMNIFCGEDLGFVKTKVTSSGVYKSITFNGETGFYCTTGSISFNTNGGVGSFNSKTVTIGVNGHVISSSDLPTTNPTKAYYTFGGWYTDETLETPALGYTTYTGIELYAKWNLIDYQLEVVDVFNSGLGGSDKSASTNPTTFNYETYIPLTDPECGDYVFGGWYLDSECNNKINILDGEVLVTYLSNNKVKLYALWYNNGTDRYVITYSNSNEDIICIPYDSFVDDGFDWTGYTLPVMTENDRNYDVTIYFGGWFKGDTEVTSITPSLFTYNSSAKVYELELVAKWLDKNVLNIVASNFGTLRTVYYSPGTSFRVPDLSNENKSILASQSLVLINWQLNDGTTYVAGANATLTNQTTLTANLKQYVSFTIGANDYTNITAVLTSGAGYIVTIDEETGIPTATAFSGTSLGNDVFMYVTKDSQFTAKYAANGGENNGATISGTDPTTIGTSNTTYRVVSAVTITPKGNKQSTCLLPTTEVMLYDGTIKQAKDITKDDLIVSYNHLTGKFEASRISFNVFVDYELFDIIELTFENGKVMKVATGHGMFNMDYNKYEIYYGSQFEKHIGETFATVDYIDGEFVIVGSKLISVSITKEYVQKYSPLTEYNVNCVTDGILTIPDDIEGMFDGFTFNSDLTIDMEEFANDIATYGVFEYEDVSNVVPEYVFDVFNFKYFKTFILKGVLTIEQVNHWIAAYIPQVIEQSNLDFDFANRELLSEYHLYL